MGTSGGRTNKNYPMVFLLPFAEENNIFEELKTLSTNSGAQDPWSAPFSNAARNFKDDKCQLCVVPVVGPEDSF